MSNYVFASIAPLRGNQSCQKRERLASDEQQLLVLETHHNTQQISQPQMPALAQ